jgi:hypothetical protein
MGGKMMQMMSKKGFGMMQVWHILRYCSSIYLPGETKKSLDNEKDSRKVDSRTKYLPKTSLEHYATTVWSIICSCTYSTF